MHSSLIKPFDPFVMIAANVLLVAIVAFIPTAVISLVVTSSYFVTIVLPGLSKNCVAKVHVVPLPVKVGALRVHWQNLHLGCTEVVFGHEILPGSVTTPFVAT